MIAPPNALRRESPGAARRKANVEALVIHRLCREIALARLAVIPARVSVSVEKVFAQLVDVAEHFAASNHAAIAIPAICMPLANDRAPVERVLFRCPRIALIRCPAVAVAKALPLVELDPNRT